MNKIKSMLKEASTRQIINDVDKNHIISNIDTNKVLNNQNKKKMPRRKLIPLFASCILIFGAILSISLYFGLKSNDKGVTRTYDDEFLNELEEFYEDNIEDVRVSNFEKARLRLKKLLMYSYENINRVVVFII